MPTYQYQCGSCEEQLEVVQSFSDDALTECPACGKATLRKVYGSVGVVFKGSGFYRTDSRSASSAATPAASPATPAPAAKTESSAPATTPAPAATPSTPAS